MEKDRLSRGEMEKIIETMHCMVSQCTKVEDELKESNEEFKKFVYAIIHDLKSLTIGLHGIANLLYKNYGDKMDETGCLYCRQIMSNAGQIDALIKELNIFIETKERPLQIEEIDLQKVMKIIVNEFSLRVNERRINLSFTNMPTMRADKSLVIRALRNLVDNALKHAGDQLSQVFIEYEKDGDFHILSVRDNGAGIKSKIEGDLKKIFVPFERHPASREIEGIGLGLSIVQEIAKRHGGRAWIESDPGESTAFFLSIFENL